MKWLLIIGCFFLLCILVVVTVGYLMPVKHTAQTTACINTTRTELWNTISAFQDYPRWRSNVAASEPVAAESGKEVWLEKYSNGDEIAYETTQVNPEKNLTRRIHTQNLPFGGAWEFHILDRPDCVELTIIEKGEVYNPIFRFMSRYVFGHEKSINEFILDLRNKYPE